MQEPKDVALQLNEHINQQNVAGLSRLMTEQHRIIDRAGKSVEGKDAMTKAWNKFFEQYPEYRNTFERIESCESLIILLGYANWRKGEDPDYAIWTATNEHGLVAEWLIYGDNQVTRLKFGL
jgi:hypothetical protein